MAITHIHPITGNIADTIRYAMNDKVESVKNIEEWKAVYESRQHFVPILLISEREKLHIIL